MSGYAVTHRCWLWAWVLASSCLSLTCAEQYCQSGPKSATQCYPINDVEWQETQVRGELPQETSIEPAPGCVQASDVGLVQRPLRPGDPPQAGWYGPPASSAYVMSGACVTRRLPAPGAVR